jgi:hypothetical protein
MPQYWTPTATGRDFEFQRVMKPLEKYREDVLVMTGLSQHEVAAALQDGAGDHVRAFSTYLNGVRSKKTLGADFQAGISADQVAAKVHGEKTRLASLELTCENSRTVGECDSYTCAYQTMAYKSSTEPLTPEMNPRVVFERMFGDMDLSSSPAQRKNQELYRRSILDLTMQDASSLQRKLGPTDRGNSTNTLPVFETWRLASPRRKAVPSRPSPQGFMLQRACQLSTPTTRN